MPYDRTVTLESLIHTAGIRTAAILAALFNAAVKIGHGNKDSGPGMITQDQASAILKAQPKTREGKKLRYFDYLYGKRLKIDLSEAYTSGIVAGQYDFYYGRGTAKRAFEILKATGDPCHSDILALQQTSRLAAGFRISGTSRQGPGTVTEGNLAEAMELLEPPTDEEVERLREKYGVHSPEYQSAFSRQVGCNRYRETPCTTINL
ncbi:MAG: hypothetical protein A2650_04580 [Candidatus Yanofskybacteria bacterium RIFCSPHIGHO2_01_FULL_41_53]|uniref:Uncharacterized protein n=1 Tax=Candidatus Yanofskybacteria bacterium RIFCSPHIGHO2_01_FULL_41_53 TaxID=1802663 RepID=A0A1F8EJN2_9BACT|nr:MAG: hypothetical protein A2650_04580 [Candidatus Yanofskybacteria bacterium RIFCSPHIGHO2_01_FULL_41_53]OGN18388.1 MAG: hypothetical protein A3F48_03060 [Candidatus Yanofskybacteria bacterium RIFCSPHIGHO2_12_FULL_41_9]OGN22622.1 MAG: hypothetical protein A2916_03190 [Candidatus Yanofskybacteria bacterium RIFCSPLOWO2_01_FULL_41_67]OGN29780.1 MAG: hypothetical protein A3H54_04355 [Candidatus Yanofskybacteria bacterium RIFCSPLOWO2_02_FULL_41_13]